MTNDTPPVVAATGEPPYLQEMLDGVYAVLQIISAKYEPTTDTHKMSRNLAAVMLAVAAQHLGYAGVPLSTVYRRAELAHADGVASAEEETTEAFQHVKKMAGIVGAMLSAYSLRSIITGRAPLPPIAAEPEAP